MKLSRFVLTFTGALLLCSCGGRHTAGQHADNEVVAMDSVSMIAPVYAQGFKVKYLDDMILLDINDPENREAERFHFALTEKDYSGEIPEGYSRLNIPVESAICMTSLQLSNFLKLGIPEKVVGITSTRHLPNGQMKRQLKEGATHKIGI
ncbi:MAG: iron ABC transporter substrate-binding protein, partial [Muribaculaceae bacterium]|nr:iron ABC transporter substrate-binding protein [Muribaculaceae bacterium]